MTLSRRLAGTAFLLGMLSLVGKGIGLLREVVLARVFGAGAELDAFFVGYTLPELASFVALYVALYLFIPLYVELREEDEADAGRFASAYLSRAGLLLVGLALGLALMADPLVVWIAPELNATLRSVAATALRGVAAVVVWRGLEGALRGVLNAHRRFVAPAVASILVSATVITILVSLQPRLGIHALTLGVVLGGLAPVVLLLPLAVKVVPGLRRPQWNHTALVRVRERLPWFVGIEVLGLTLPLIDRAIAGRGLDAGSISALNFARILNEVPFQVVALTLAMALLPELSTLNARNDQDGFRALLRRSVRGVVSVTLPAAALFIVLRESVVAAFYQRGAFDAGDVSITAAALLGFAVGLPFMAASAVLFNAAIAAGRYRLLVGVRLGCLVAKVGISLALVQVWGLAGLALGTAAYHAVLALSLTLFLGGGWRGWIPKPLTLVVAAGIAAGAAWGVIRFWEWQLPSGDPWPLLGQGVAWAGGAVTYLIACRVGRVEEVRWMERLVRARLAGGKGMLP